MGNSSGEEDLFWCKETLRHVMKCFQGYAIVENSLQACEQVKCLTSLFACWVIVHVFVVILFFSNSHFSEKIFRNTIRVSNGLDPDQDRHFVGPERGPNCLQSLSEDDKSRTLARKELKVE